MWVSAPLHDQLHHMCTGLYTVQSWCLTRSMVEMLCSWMAAMCCLLSRMARIPPCTPGCSVFTRPVQTQQKVPTATVIACHNAVWHSLCNEWSVERTDLLHPCIQAQGLDTPSMPQELSSKPFDTFCCCHGFHL